MENEILWEIQSLSRWSTNYSLMQEINSFFATFFSFTHLEVTKILYEKNFLIFKTYKNLLKVRKSYCYENYEKKQHKLLLIKYTCNLWIFENFKSQ